MINYIVDFFSLIIQGVKVSESGYNFDTSFATIGNTISQNLINLGHSGSSGLASIGANELYTILALFFLIGVGFVLLRAIFGLFGLIRTR